MNEQVTRQILWNIPVAFVVIMYTLLAALGVAFVYAGMYSVTGASRWARQWGIASTN